MAKETLGFQTQVKQLLNLMVNSLYSNREIFLRELISNASDACDKLRFLSIKNPELISQDSNLRLRIEIDNKARTLTISDNGVGMSRQDTIDQLGTIAHSGTSEFLNHLSGDEKKDSHLIGQFGVGFYSAFIVADEVVVRSRKAGLDAKDGVVWSSKGDGEFSIETQTIEQRGTSIELHLKDTAQEFLDAFRIKHLIEKYSNHINLPIEMLKEKNEEIQTNSEDESNAKAENKADKSSDAPEYEVVNKATALWTRAKSEIEDNDYIEFYKDIASDYQEPLAWAHNKVEGKHEYTSLIYIPSHPGFDLYNREAPKGLKLFIERVFILDNAEQFLPLYLRFVKGVIDTSDLPLNVSREILQESPITTSIKSAITKKVLETLSKLAENDADKYKTFWKEFGLVIKEGIIEDFSNKESIASLLRFNSTKFKDEPSVSLEDYLTRVLPEQDKIYYLIADTKENALSSPLLEVFNSKGIEVLLLSDRIDDWVMSNLREYQKHEFIDISRDDLDLSKFSLDDSASASAKEETGDSKDFLQKLQEVLKDRVKEVKSSTRLTTSVAVLTLAKDDIGLQMRRMLEAAGQSIPEQKPILEVNLEHSLVKQALSAIDNFEVLAHLICDEAQLAAGQSLTDVSGFLERVNQLILQK